MADRILIAFPFTGTLVGGSYHSAALLAAALEQETAAHCEILLPALGANSCVFQDAGLTPMCYGLRDKHVRLMHQTKSIPAKARALGSHQATYSAALRWLKSNRPALVHINDDRTMLSWGLAARRLGIPLVWHVRQRSGSRWIDRIRLRLADHLIFLAEDARGHRFQARQLRRKAHCVIYNAVDTSVFYPPSDRSSAKAYLGLSPDSIVLSYVGNLIPRKRPEWVVEAGISLRDERKDVEVLIAGQDFSEGRIEKQLKERIASSGHEDAFHILGYRSDVADLLRASDILGLPSIAEPFGRVVIEAMACGVAVVATDSGGVPEIIEDQVSGLLVPSESSGAFSMAISRLASDTNQRVSLAGEGLKVVREKFSVDAMSSKVMAVYERVLGPLRSGR